MNTIELETQSPPDAVTRDKRQCIASLMDRHPETFAAPEAAPTWADFVEQNCTPQGRDQLTLDMAVGRLIQVMRAAQDAVPERIDLNEVLRRAEEAGVPDITPDPALQAVASEEMPPEELQSMARAMSLYKTCRAEGIATGDEIEVAINAGFEHVPATSPLMRSLVATAKEVALIDLRYVLGAAA